jgi:methionyl-tRNA formyltransferase
MNNVSKPNVVFWGTSQFAVDILTELKKDNLLPSLVITMPDKPQGRKLILTSPPVKIWAEENNIKFLQPEKLDLELIKKLQTEDYNLFIVASYGKIIPQSVLDIPEYKTLNVHPSLLPKYRGASPIQSALLSGEKETGTSIMLLDEKMDHGPILDQEKIDISNIPHIENLSKELAQLGGKMLINIIPKWIQNKITPEEQDHNLATFTKKIEKKDAEINLASNPLQNFRKIQAFGNNPKPYFFIQKDGKNIRVIIKSAEYKNNKLILKKVIPEGKKEMNYSDFLTLN